MRTWLRLALIGLLSVVMSGVVAAAGTSPAFATTGCTSVIGVPYDAPTIVNDTVEVPPGATCLIINATITQNVVVDRGAQFVMVGATVLGSVTSNGAAYVELHDCAEVCEFSQPSQVNGNLVLTNMQPSRYGGVICDASVIGGTVLLQGNQAPIWFGSGPFGPGPGCTITDQMRVGGAFVISGNRAPITVSLTTVRGSLQCSSNTPAPINGGGNTAGVKTGQCSAF